MENLKLILAPSTLSTADYLDDLPRCPRLKDDKFLLSNLLYSLLHVAIQDTRL
jgi:hypothetical protein